MPSIELMLLFQVGGWVSGWVGGWVLLKRLTNPDPSGCVGVPHDI